MKISIGLNSHHLRQGPDACKTFVARAKFYGANVITITPTFFYNEQSTDVKPDLPSGQVQQCMTEISNNGIEVVYRPLMESMPSFLHDGRDGHLRHNYISYDERYFRILFREN